MHSLVTVTLFSVIVIGAAAHILSVTDSTIGKYWAFVAFAVAVALLTILTLPALYVSDQDLVGITLVNG